MTKHTHGPWMFVEGYRMSGKYAGSWGVVPVDLDLGVTGPAFALLPPGGRDDTRRANARLIAAAPELLEALKEMVWCNEAYAQDFGPDERVSIAFARAEAAIAKATGK